MLRMTGKEPQRIVVPVNRSLALTCEWFNFQNWKAAEGKRRDTFLFIPPRHTVLSRNAQWQPILCVSLWEDLCVCKQINSFKHIAQYTLALFFLLHPCFEHWLARPLLIKYSCQFPANEGASRLFAVIFCALGRRLVPSALSHSKELEHFKSHSAFRFQHLLFRSMRQSFSALWFKTAWLRRPYSVSCFCKCWYDFVVKNLKPYCLDLQAGPSHLLFKFSPPQKGHNNSTCLTGFIRLSG